VSEEKQEATYEDRKRCPKCEQPGEETKSLPVRGLPKGTTVKTIYCRNKFCKWCDTCWMVQVNPDGSVPPPTDHTKSKKQYEGFEGHDQLANQIMQGIENDRLASLEKHSEIRKRL
jgi:hypothetical protein